MQCKRCGCEEFRKEMKGPHMGIYCAQCGAWQMWEKYSTNPKTKEEYRNEYLDKQPATDQQMAYIRNLLRQNPLSKYQASKIIEVLGGETN